MHICIFNTKLLCWKHQERYNCIHWELNIEEMKIYKKGIARLFAVLKIYPKISIKIFLAIIICSKVSLKTFFEWERWKTRCSLNYLQSWELFRSHDDTVRAVWWLSECREVTVDCWCCRYAELFQIKCRMLPWALGTSAWTSPWTRGRGWSGPGSCGRYNIVHGTIVH